MIPFILILALQAAGVDADPNLATGPTPVIDLRVEHGSEGPHSLKVLWTAPVDDGGPILAAIVADGQSAVQYSLRYSTSPITSATFISATPVAGVPAPADPGVTQNVVVSGLAPGVTYYFALESLGQAGFWSRLSNVASGTTAAAAPSPSPSPSPVAGPEETALVEDDEPARCSAAGPGVFVLLPILALLAVLRGRVTRPSE